MQRVFVLDAEKRPLTPCRPARARLLLTQGKAAVLRRFPFTIILLKREHPPAQIPSLRLKIDPGSKTTGLAIVNDETGEAVWAAELTHRGAQVKANLDDRRLHRRSRRQRHTRYRPARWQNRRRPAGWLAPSLRSRIQNVVTWGERLRRLCPLSALSYELVRFDTQALQDPEIAGVQYQHGTLFGIEVREYLLLKWGYRCVYCGKTGVPFEAEHIVPRSRGGTNRITNLTLACHACNQTKGNQTAEEFGYPQIQAQAHRPLTDAAAVNATRWWLYERLGVMGLPIETATGGRTKWNRVRRGIPKTHWLDAVCTGASTPERIRWKGIRPLLIKATGRQTRQMQNVDKHGFPRGAPKRVSVVAGFHTGDMVRAVVPPGRATSGVHIGRVLVRATRNFDVTTARGRIPNIHAKYCRSLHRQDGYTYSCGKEAALPPLV